VNFRSKCEGFVKSQVIFDQVHGVLGVFCNRSVVQKVPGRRLSSFEILEVGVSVGPKENVFVKVIIDEIYCNK
jgi:hypothetical protein